MTPLEQSIARIMQLNRDMTKDAEFEAALRRELNAAFHRGYDKAYKQYANYSEDMGK